MKGSGSRREVVRRRAQWRMKGKMLSLNGVKETRGGGRDTSIIDDT